MLDPAIRSFDKAQFIYQRMSSQGTDQTDIGAFRGLDGAQPSVVGVVHIPHLEPGPFPRQAPWSQR